MIFQKLKKFRTKIAAINIISMGIIFLIIFTRFYFYFEDTLEMRERALLFNTAEIALIEIVPYNIHDMIFTVEETEEEMLFFVQTDLSGEIISFSANAIGRRDFLAALLEDVHRVAYNNGILENEYGEVNFVDAAFAYFISEQPHGRIYVFVDMQTRGEMLMEYVFIAAVGLATAVVCVFFISVYLASRIIVPIRDSMEKQEKFIADASHELRTPLAVIRSNVEMIIDAPHMTVEENMKWLNYVLKESKRMAKITEDLLFLSKADIRNKGIVNDVEFEKEELDLSALITDVYDSFLKLFEENNLTDNKSRITRDIYMSANENQIRQLMTILLDNAIKYTKEGGVTVELECDGEYAYIKVTDTGQGIPEDMLNRIFERFVRTDKARSRAEGGAGLGLSIAKSIAEGHGGQISVESEVGKGSSFRVNLPL